MERTEPRRPPEAPRQAPRLDDNRRFVNIGKSVHIKGELSGNEDLTIDGTVEGKIVLNDHNLTIGANGKITAEVSAMAVVVLGHVVGDILAEERIEVKDGGTVEGDLIAPKVVLAEGARFKGAIDMLSGGSSAPRPRPQPTQESSPFGDVPKEEVEKAVDDVMDDLLDEKPASDTKASKDDKGDKGQSQGQSQKNDKSDKKDKGEKAGAKEDKGSNKLAGMFDEFDPSNP